MMKTIWGIIQVSPILLLRNTLVGYCFPKLGVTNFILHEQKLATFYSQMFNFHYLCYDLILKFVK